MILIPTVSFIVTRTEPGEYLDGIYTPGVTEDIEFTGCIQPYNSSYAEKLYKANNAQEETGMILVMTNQAEIKTANQSTGQLADIITYKDQKYRVDSSASWDLISGVTHYEAKASFFNE